MAKLTDAAINTTVIQTAFTSESSVRQTVLQCADMLPPWECILVNEVVIDGAVRDDSPLPPRYLANAIWDNMPPRQAVSIDFLPKALVYQP